VKPSPAAKTPEMCASPLAAAAFGGVDATAGFGRGLGPGPSSTANSHISSDHGSDTSEGKLVTRSDDFTDARDSPIFGASSPPAAVPDPPVPPVSTYQPTVYSNVPSGFWVWLEVSASRMRALATLPNSILYSSFVYPTVQVMIASICCEPCAPITSSVCAQLFIEKGNEDEALDELNSVAEAATWIQDLGIIVQITMDKSVFAC
jgi:hypothetical protein